MTLLRLRPAKLAALAAVVVGLVAVGLVAGAPGVSAQTTRDRPTTAFRFALMGTQEIGASVREVEQADVTRAKLQGLSGAVVEDVQADGPAAKAGLKAGDVIIAFDGEQVRSVRHLTRLVEETPAGREITAQVVRNGEKLTLKMTPAAPDVMKSSRRAFEPFRSLPDQTFMQRYAFSMPRPELVMPSIRNLQRGGRLGAGVMDLTEQLADYFGAKEGVLVTSVEDNTPAKTAGLKAGDVITRVDGSTVRDGAELRRRLAAATGEVSLTVLRDRKELTLKAKLSEGELRRSTRR